LESHVVLSDREVLKSCGFPMQKAVPPEIAMFLAPKPTFRLL
jgi:hypothetical protein